MIRLIFRAKFFTRAESPCAQQTSMVTSIVGTGNTMVIVTMTSHAPQLIGRVFAALDGTKCAK